MKLFAQFIVCVLLLCVTPVLLAQESCPALVTSALEAVTTACDATGRNQACYGNVSLQAVPQADVSNFTFEKAGDIVDVASLQSLTLSSLNADTDEWGVALLKVQANVPDTLPGQNVTLLLFGDVEVQNAAGTQETAATSTPSPTATPVLLNVTSNGKINVRGEPSTSGPIVGSLAAHTTLTADGRNTAGDWLHVQLSDGSSGWVFASLVTLDGEVSTLPDATGATSDTPAPPEEVPAAPLYGPMQAFYFKTGLNDSPCSEAPDSGILIQTPEGAGKIDLVMNEVSVSLGSTAYVQAQPGGDMVVNVVEGQATVSAFGTTVTVPAGTRARVPLDANLAASGVPVGPEPYDAAELAALPLNPLPKVISVAPALTADEIAALGPIVPLEGQWTISGKSASDNPICDKSAGGLLDLSTSVNETMHVFSTLTKFNLGVVGDGTFSGVFSSDISLAGSSVNPTITVSNDSTYTIHDDQPLGNGAGSYSYLYVIKVVSPAHIEGVTTLTLQYNADLSFVCNITSTYTMDLTDTNATSGSAHTLLSAGGYTVSTRSVASPGGGLSDAECENQALTSDSQAFQDFLDSRTDVTPGIYENKSRLIHIIWVSDTRIDGAQVDPAQPGCAIYFTITPLS